MTVILTIIAAIVIFALLIFIHELGHFAVAKAVGIKVNEFALGMGPALFKKQGKETLYSLRAFPIGGYCKMEGEDEESDHERAFHNKPAWARFLVVLAGPMMNFLGAIIILSLMFTFIGSATMFVGSLSNDSPAYEAGIREGDKVLTIDGAEAESWVVLQEEISGTTNETVTIEVERDGKEIEIVSGLTESEDGRQIVGMIPEYKRDFITSVKNGYSFSASIVKEMLSFLGNLFTGQGSSADVVGPIGIVSVVSDSVKNGFLNVTYLTALLSLNLGLINLLPFPALDGGRLLFILIRKITGKAITDEMEGRIHFMGMMFLIALMIYVTFNDVQTFILK